MILGIDGSTTATGCALMSDGETKKLIAYYEFRRNREEDANRKNRIRYMLTEISNLIKNNPIDYIYMEEVPPIKNNSDTVLALGILQGGVLMLAYEHNIPIEWTPVTEWQNALGIKNSKISDINTKQQSIALANKLYNINLIYKGKDSKYTQDNAADAICILHYNLNKDKYCAKYTKFGYLKE